MNQNLALLRSVDYTVKAREALLLVEDALRKQDLQLSKQLISEFVFCEKSGRSTLNSSLETQLVVILLTDFFNIEADATRIPSTQLTTQLFFNIFEPGKNSRKFLLLKFILISCAIQSTVALNAAGTYLLDPLTKDFRISADFGRLLINEVTFFSNSSFDKLKSLPTVSPIFVNSLCLIFAEIFKDEQLPTPIIASLITEFIQYAPSPPFMFTFAIPAHAEIGALILGSFFRWTILSELYDPKPLYSKMHLNLLEVLSDIDQIVTSKPVISTKHLETIIDQIERAGLIKEPETIQKSLEKFAQLVQVSKIFLFGNIPQFADRLSKLPKNALLDLVRGNLMAPIK